MQSPFPRHFPTKLYLMFLCIQSPDNEREYEKIIFFIVTYKKKLNKNSYDHRISPKPVAAPILKVLPPQSNGLI
jgi:hypothetical protein